MPCVATSMSHTVSTGAIAPPSRPPTATIALAMPRER